jgi:hypothetical protein
VAEAGGEERQGGRGGQRRDRLTAVERGIRQGDGSVAAFTLTCRLGLLNCTVAP